MDDNESYGNGFYSSDAGSDDEHVRSLYVYI